MKKIGGFTLAEVTIALFISSLILSVLFTLFSLTNKIFQTQIELIAIQEKATLAIELLGSAIRRAGDIGCAKLTKNFLIDTNNFFPLNINNRLIVEKNKLALWYVSTENALITRFYSAVIYISPPLIVENDDFLFITDCSQGEVVQVISVKNNSNAQRIVINPILKNSFKMGASVYRLERRVFSIEKTTLIENSAPSYILYQLENDKNKSEVIEDVKELEFTKDNYGVSIKLSFSFLKNEVRHWFSYIAPRS